VLGALLGRWWGLSAAVALGLWVGFTEEVEVPGWYLGLGYGAISGFGVALGVLVRRGLARSRA
jgi:hypothetical protein